jgi:hypothetical protein
MRDVIETEWPELAAKLLPSKDSSLSGSSAVYEPKSLRLTRWLYVRSNSGLDISRSCAGSVQVERTSAMLARNSSNCCLQSSVRDTAR